MPSTPSASAGCARRPDQLYKITGVDLAAWPPEPERISAATQMLVGSIAQTIESIQEREEIAVVSSTLQDIAETISSSLQLEDILESVVESVQRYLNATTVSLLMVEAETRRLRFRAVRPPENLAILRRFEQDLFVGKGLVGYVAETAAPLCIFDAQADPRFYSRPDKSTGFQTRSVLCVPIVLEGQVIGVIQVIDSHVGKYNLDSLATLETIAAIAATAIRNAYQHAAMTEAETLASMSVVASDFAHTIKTDVGLIDVVANSLLTTAASGEQGVDGDTLRRKLTLIKERSAGLLARMEEIRTPFAEIKLEPLDLCALLDGILDAMQQRFAAAAPVPIERSYAACPEVWTDRKRLSSVLQKVVENSFMAMADELGATGATGSTASTASPARLAVTVRPLAGGFVELGIADTGPGIDPGKKKSLFQISPTQIVAGTPADLPDLNESRERRWGYGLWSSRLTMKKLGGTIAVDDTYEGGTRMIVIVPQRATPEPQPR